MTNVCKYLFRNRDVSKLQLKVYWKSGVYSSLGCFLQNCKNR